MLAGSRGSNVASSRPAISGSGPTLPHSTAVPHAIASTADRPRPAWTEGLTVTALPRYSAGRSLSGTVALSKRTSSSPSPASATARRSGGRSCAPATTSGCARRRKGGSMA